MLKSDPPFTLGLFVGGTVRANGWWKPYSGQRVYLRAYPKGVLTVSFWPHDGLRYCWPRGRTTAEGSFLALRHYRRKTQRDPFSGGDHPSNPVQERAQKATQPQPQPQP